MRKNNVIANAAHRSMPSLADCQDRLRGIRHELDKHRRWMEARTLRLDCIIGDIDLALENASHASGALKGRTTARHTRPSHADPDISLSSVDSALRGDGYWDVAIDTLPPFRLPPLLGRVFDILAKDTGHDVGDGLVGFKSNAYLLTELHRLSLPTDSTLRRVVGRLSARGLAQAVCDLRKRLARVVLHGDALVQTRRGVGRRIALRKRNATDWH